MRQNPPDGPSRASADAQLAGLERMRLAGLIDERRYEAQRARLLELHAREATDAPPAADPLAPTAEPMPPPASTPAPSPDPSAPPAWTPAQPAPPAWGGALPPSPPRPVPVAAWAAVAVALVVVGTGTALAMSHLGKHTIATAVALPSAAAHPSAAGTPVPVPTATPLPQGLDVAGGSQPAIAWRSLSDHELALTPVAGGVDYVLREPFHNDVWVTAPVTEWVWAMRADAHVVVVGGEKLNSVGIGCATSDRNHAVNFTVDDTRQWTITLDSKTTHDLVDSGSASPANLLDDGNDFSVVCVTRPDGQLHLMFALNDTVLADTTIAAPANLGWIPTVVQCSCAGPEETRFTNMEMSAVPRT